MRRPLSKRKCQHCKTFFEPDPRSAGRQHYCATPACRKASKAASQRRWLQQPRNGGCVATERKAGKFRLFILFIGITEWTQIAPSNGF
jgi:hypothetical protein